MKPKSASIGLFLAIASLAASAATYSFTMPIAPSSPYAEGKSVAGPSFVDLWSFIAPATAVSVSGSVISLTIPGLNIDNIRLELYTDAPAFVASGNIGESSKIDDAVVAAGAAYHFRVTGDVVGEPAGFYTFAAVASPVPEISTAALWVSGVGVMVLLNARRRAKD